MTTKLILTEKFQIASDGTKACLVMPERKNAIDKIEYYVGDATPADTDDAFPWKEPINIPNGVKTWIRGSGVVYLNPYTAM